MGNVRCGWTRWLVIQTDSEVPVSDSKVTGAYEMEPQEAKCPKCRQGQMKMVLATSPLTSTPKTKPMQARCNKCGHEEDYTTIYPRKQK